MFYLVFTAVPETILKLIVYEYFTWGAKFALDLLEFSSSVNPYFRPLLLA